MTKDKKVNIEVTYLKLRPPPAGLICTSKAKSLLRPLGLAIIGSYILCEKATCHNKGEFITDDFLQFQKTLQLN